MKYLFLWIKKGYGYLFLGFVFYLYYFFNENVGVYDWSKEIYYFQYIKLSLSQFSELPFFWWDRTPGLGYPAIQRTAYFISNPETFIFSPLIYLLKFMDSVFFIKFLVLVHFIIGAIGSVFLAKKIHWNDAQKRIFYILFLFSPIIIQHLTIGYLPWMNLFFIPWFFYFLAEEAWLRRAIGLSVLFSITLLQGGVHVFVWMIMFFGVFCLFFVSFSRNISILKSVPVIGFLSILLSLVRLVMTAGSFSDFKQEFIPGYSIGNFLTWAILPTYFPEQSTHYIEQIWHGIGYWDAAVFWGFSLIYLIVMIMKSKIFIHKNVFSTKNTFYRSIFFTSLIMLLLSFGNIYPWLISTLNSFITIPFSQGAEKYAYRFALLAYFGFSLVLAAYTRELNAFFKAILKVILNTMIGLWLRWGLFVKRQESRLRRIFSLIVQFSKPILRYFPHFSIQKGMMEKLLMILFLLSALLRIISPGILPIVKNQIEFAYQYPEKTILSEVMENKNVIPLTTYIAKFEKKFEMMQQILIYQMIGFFAAAIIVNKQHTLARFIKNNFLVIRNYAAIPSNWFHLLYEILLFIPLLYSSGMWLWLGTSTPSDSFRALKMAIDPPVVLSTPISRDLQDSILVTPSQFVIPPSKESYPSTYYLPDIPSTDLRFLHIPLGNATMEEYTGGIQIHSIGEGEINIKANRQNFNRSVAITIFAWVLVLSGWFYCEWKKIWN